MSLFKPGNFRLRSGHRTPWSIHCDEFADEDWQCVVNLMLERHPNFSEVYGHPMLQTMLSQHITTGGILLVKDVLLAHEQMDYQRMFWRTRQRTHNLDIQGFVIFAIVPCPHWVRALWQLDVRTDKWEPMKGATS